MQKVTSDAILRAIYDLRYEMFADIMANKRWNRVEYSFEQFRTDMLGSELLSDSKTIKTKWDMLAAKGVIKPYGRTKYGNAELNLWAFSGHMAPSALDLLRQTGTEPVSRRTAAEVF